MRSKKQYSDLRRSILRKEPWREDFLALVADYYATEPTGGSLHICLDDGNMQERNVAWCAGYAYGIGDLVGIEIAAMLSLMSRKERNWVFKQYPRYRARWDKL